MGSLYIVAFVLAVAGGAIAYGGDRLGTYVGKKRISFKWRRISLRPRYTATLYTVLSGSAIAVLTLVLLISLDSGFKSALLEGPQLIAHYKDQIKSERRAAAAAEEHAQQAALKLADAKSRLAPVQQQLAGVRGLLSHSRQALLARQQQLGQAQTRLSVARTALGHTDSQLREARDEVRLAKQAAASAENNVRAAQQRVSALIVRQKALKTANTDLKIANSGLKTVNVGLQRKNALLQAASEQWEKRTTASQQKLIFRNDQELGRLVVRAAQPVSLIEDKLTAFLNGLGQTAEARGAAVGVNKRAVVVAAPVSPDSIESDSIEYSKLSLVDENKAIATLAQLIAARSSAAPAASVVVVARAVTNSFQGEQTSISLQPYENELIYHKGDAIATSTITGAQTLQIIDALGTFLTDNVRPAVLLQKFIPQKDPETGKPVIGSVLDEATSQSLALQVERLGGTARVTAYASEDTYSSGPLHLRFGITPVGPPVTLPPPAAVGGRA